jgi:hypothetical protein
MKKWSFIGTAGGNGKISLDIFKPGFATHPVIDSQSRLGSSEEFQDATVYVTEGIPVLAGQGIGVTVSAGPDSKTEANVASVLCLGEANFSPGSSLAIWEAPLTARALLKRSHTLHARATIVSHDSAGATHTTVVTVTVRAGKSKH